jgi:membrane-associated phospholipid phosphatase
MDERGELNEGLWAFVTKFGDSAVVLPLAAVLAAALWRMESRQAAVAWLRAAAWCMAALILLKLLFLSWGHTWYGRLESPSGHAGMSVLVYGALAALAALRAPRPWPVAIGAVAAAFILAIALSRKVLGAHSVAEVLLGCLVGGICLAHFVVAYRRLAPQPRTLRLAPVYAAVGLVVLAMFDTSFTPETYIWRTAQRIKSEIRAQGMMRAPPVQAPQSLAPGQWR